ncbi:MAG: AAA family ATPase [Chloroflexota bacterium]
MIPVYMTISGFLSYRNPVEIDFTAFELACISGSNGAGKSTLLDAMTWALFGQARRRDDSLINLQSTLAQVSLVFAYEGNYFQVQRTKLREKTMMLEFHILQQDAARAAAHASGNGSGGAAGVAETLGGAWRPLTEHTLRATENRIQQTLRMDYETFINASFFLQGKADQFTQQKPGDRKRILSSILGLEVWERYKDAASNQRKAIETEIRGLDGRLAEIMAELAEEDARRAALRKLEDELQVFSDQYQTQEKLVQSARQMDASLQNQQRLVDAMARSALGAGDRSQQTLKRLQSRRGERAAFDGHLAHAAEIEAAYAGWQAARAGLQRLDETAAQFREQEKAREAPRAELQAARARLEQELASLQARQAQLAAAQDEIAGLESQVGEQQTEIAAAEARRARRANLDENLLAMRQRQADARAENPRLKKEMDELKARIDHLQAVDGAECPLCGQPMGQYERFQLIERLQAQGQEMGDRYRANQAIAREIDEAVSDLQQQIQGLAHAEAELRRHTQLLAQLETRLDGLRSAAAEWDAGGALRLAEIELDLRAERYAPEARACLEAIDAELKQIGYDAAAHDAARRTELAGRSSEAELRELEKARAALEPLQREIDELEVQLADQQAEYARLQAEHAAAAASLAADRAAAPDLYAAESQLFLIKENENRARQSLGMARQKVLVLDDLKARRKGYEAQREDYARQVSQFRQLERAFSKDGVPALLIEQALPEIEGRANDILDRLTGGSMAVRFVTQAQYKDKHREDLRETLDIQISDGSGVRDYELYSGGEAFRVNFAIRLALSEVLAQRSGARLQTLVIDEGFGSQDAQGRQRLVEAINLVRQDFRKILVITHIDELKDAFSHRIEVEKTDAGSIVHIV